MTTRKNPLRAATTAGRKTYTCYGCGKKIRAAEKIIESEQAEYCETCYRDKYFYHTTNGGKRLEGNHC